MALSREQVAMRVAQELQDGYYVNLGIGIPTLVANYVPDNIEVMLQSENGLLGMGQYPTKAELDADMINAGKETVTAAKGAKIYKLLPIGRAETIYAEERAIMKARKVK